MNKKLLAALFVFTGAVFFSAKAIMVKLAYQETEEVSSVNLLLLRMLLAAPIFIIIDLVYRARQKPKPLQRSHWFGIVAAGVGGYYLASYFDFIGLELINAGLERLILFIFPTLVVLINAVVLKKRITKVQIGALVLTYAGMTFAIIENVNSGNSSNILLGALFIFLSALSYACYLVGVGQLVTKIGTIRFTSYSMLVSTACILIHYLVTEKPDLLSFPNKVYWLAALMAIVSTVIPAFLLYEGIRVIGSSNAAIIAGIGPISTIILAFIFLEEKFGWMQGIGTFLVIGGVLLISTSNVEKKAG